MAQESTASYTQPCKVEGNQARKQGKQDSRGRGKRTKQRQYHPLKDEAQTSSLTRPPLES
eukprot:12885635-Prorocentrum_lima.AAC.1